MKKFSLIAASFALLTACDVKAVADTVTGGSQKTSSVGQALEIADVAGQTLCGAANLLAPTPAIASICGLVGKAVQTGLSFAPAPLTVVAVTGHCDETGDEYRNDADWRSVCLPTYQTAQNELEWCRSNRDKRPAGHYNRCDATGIYDQRVEAVDRAAEVVWRDHLKPEGIPKPGLVVYDTSVECNTHSIDFVAYCGDSGKIGIRLAQIATYGSDFERNAWVIQAHEMAHHRINILEPRRLREYGRTLEASRYVELDALYHVTLWACKARLNNFEHLVTVFLPSLGPPSETSNYGTRTMREDTINDALLACDQEI